jgi:uracil-DNA glycosylase family 4
MEFSVEDKLRYSRFLELQKIIYGCRLCDRMCDSQRVFGNSSGSPLAEIMFVGEAPGRLGADSSGIPFHGDVSGHNFEELLSFAKIRRENIFVTNAVLCNPKDDGGNNSTPTKEEVHNCLIYLRAQVDLLSPKIIVTLGATALFALNSLSFLGLNLKSHVRTVNKWGEISVIPLYHPGQRAMMHRSFANQRSDYQFVADTFKAISNGTRAYSSDLKFSLLGILKYIFFNVGRIEYFRLHKIFYLIEYTYSKTYERRLTDAYFIRQKDGPYCTDLHYAKLVKGIAGLKTRKIAGTLFLELEPDFFQHHLSADVIALIDDVIRKYSGLTLSELKHKVYLTTPMRNILKLEKQGMVNMYNSSIRFF